MVYFSQETQQSWSSGVDSLNVESQEHEEEDVDGGALWLPGNVILELQMLPMVSSAPQWKVMDCWWDEPMKYCCVSIFAR